MKCSSIKTYLDEWAPRGVAFDWDNVGLQIGNLKQDVTGIVLSLDVTDQVVDEAIQKNCNVIISHHPLLFHPLKKITPDSDQRSALISKIIKNDLTIFSYHTNLDFTKDGVSFVLAEKLSLKNISFFEKISKKQVKIAVFVPSEAVDSVSQAMFSAGGGIIGEYTQCSFRSEGIGTFLGSDNTNPAVGEKGKFEQADEIRLEVLVDEWNKNKVVNAMIDAHPYEQVAYDMYPLNNASENYGIGAVGELEEPMDEEAFVAMVAKALKTPALRYSAGRGDFIKRVGVLGGDNSGYGSKAMRMNLDAFVSADVKLHQFHEATNNIVLVDAGHYETEVLVLAKVKERLEEFFKLKNEESKIFLFSKKTNPVKFYLTEGAKHIEK